MDIDKLLMDIDNICQEENVTGEFGIPFHDADKIIRIKNLITIAAGTIPEGTIPTTEIQEAIDLIQAEINRLEDPGNKRMNDTGGRIVSLRFALEAIQNKAKPYLSQD